MWSFSSNKSFPCSHSHGIPNAMCKEYSSKIHYQWLNELEKYIFAAGARSNAEQRKTRHENSSSFYSKKAHFHGISLSVVEVVQDSCQLLAVSFVWCCFAFKLFVALLLFIGVVLVVGRVRRGLNSLRKSLALLGFILIIQVRIENAWLGPQKSSKEVKPLSKLWLALSFTSNLC